MTFDIQSWVVHRRRAAWKIIKADWISYSPTRKERDRRLFVFNLNSNWTAPTRTLLSLSTPCSHSPHALFQKCSFKTNKTLSWIVSGKRGHGRREEEEDCRRKGKDFVQHGKFPLLFTKSQQENFEEFEEPFTSQIHHTGWCCENLHCNNFTKINTGIH